MSINKKDYVKEKYKWVIIGIKVGIVVTILGGILSLINISEKIVAYAQTYVQEKEVVIYLDSISYENHVGEILQRYNIKIKPPHDMGRIGIQAYIAVSYKDKEQIIYLEDVYTSDVYQAKNGVYPLLKRSGGDAICDLLEEKIVTFADKDKIERELLVIEYNTMLCVFCENDEVRRYYLFNDGTPTYKEQMEALEFLNPETGSYEYNLIYDGEVHLDAIAKGIVNRL